MANVNFTNGSFGCPISMTLLNGSTATSLFDILYILIGCALYTSTSFLETPIRDETFGSIIQL